MAHREKLFFVLASVFVTSLVMANIIGITKFFQFTVPIWDYTVMVPVGILPYPVTFLATDLICELYGRRRANFVVFTGFLMNLFLLAVCGFGRHMVADSTAWTATLAEPWHALVFPRIWDLMWIGVIGSMTAYLTAQFVDVQLFHFWKRLTKGKHLWLRNNASTMMSQLIDSTVILTIIFGAAAADGSLEAESPLGGMTNGYGALAVFIFNAYIFKFFFAAFDTPLFYIFTGLLKPLVGAPDPGEPRYDTKR